MLYMTLLLSVGGGPASLWKDSAMLTDCTHGGFNNCQCSFDVDLGYMGIRVYMYMYKYIDMYTYVYMCLFISTYT